MDKNSFLHYKKQNPKSKDQSALSSRDHRGKIHYVAVGDLRPHSLTHASLHIEIKSVTRQIVCGLKIC